MSKKTNRPKVNDSVKIIEPKFFIRCGYPLTIKSIQKDLFKDNSQNKQIITDMLEHFDIKCYSKELLLEDMDLSGGILGDIEVLIARWILVQKKWGGRNRDIYTVEIPQLKNEIFKVQFIKACYTGIYQPAYIPSRYYEDEPESPYLD